MTALAGFWSFDGSADAERACERMLAAQAIYAPDPPRCRSDGAIALGRRLRPLLPEDRFDRGPMVAASGSRILVADLRLDNRDELCAALGLSKPDARQLADAALLLRALDRWQEEAVERLVGDFAFALWDGGAQRLTLARDYAGQRPLHFHRGGSLFAFASMAKGLHALEQVPIAPNRQAVTDFVALLPEQGSDTFFEGVERVPPGHVVTVSRDRVRSRRYWRPSRAPLRLAGREDYEEALREQLDRAVAARLRGAEGDVAAHLSGGLDSAAVASTAARLLAVEGRRLTAYTAVPRPGFAGRSRDSFADEGPLAAAVAARHPNIDHVLVPASGASPVGRLDSLFFLYERPLLNLCNGVWAHAILDHARGRQSRVLLTGQLGNLTISHDGLPHLAASLRGGELLRLARLARGFRRWGARWGTIAAAAAGPAVPVPLWRWIGRMRGRGRRLTDYCAIAPGRADDPALAARAAARAHDPDCRPRRDGIETRLQALGRVDFGNYNKGMLAGWGIDVRDPTADRRLFEFCLSIPEEQFILDGVPRSLARRAFADRLPAEVTGERRKGYQAADWHEGLAAARDDIAEEVDRIAAIAGIDADLDVGRMKRLIEDWPTDGWDRPERVDHYRLALLRGISAGHFLRKACGSNL